MSDGNWIHNGSPQLDHESNYKQIMAVSIVLTCVMTVVVCLRGYVRGAMLKALGWDDFVIFFAAVTSPYPAGEISGTALSICSLAMHYCLYWPLHWPWGLGLTVAARPEPNFNSFSVIQKSWKPLTPGYCVPNVNSVYGLGAVSIFYDIVIILLPIPMIMNLHIDRRKKIGLAGIFCLGIFTTFCSIMRLVQVKEIIATGDQTGLVMWATVEMTVGVTLTCLPTLLPLIKYYQDKKISTAQRSYPLNSRSNVTCSRGVNVEIGPTRDSPEWNDRDSIDNSSQKKILGLQSSLEAYSSEESSQHQRGKNPSRGIVATTEVQVKHSSMTSDDVERERRKNNGGDW
ncbi:hypothetical protein V493_04243 [Pseudogymnoascus sp. VKM F-4281 (FW-2241)]|nr:hypothetical protein V493_04243 [Pseudogymnoascus sp. VKM F-4281 (FW-2241)]